MTDEVSDEKAEGLKSTARALSHSGLAAEFTSNGLHDLLTDSSTEWLVATQLHGSTLGDTVAAARSKEPPSECAEPVSRMVSMGTDTSDLIHGAKHTSGQQLLTPTKTNDHHPVNLSAKSTFGGAFKSKIGTKPKLGRSLGVGSIVLTESSATSDEYEGQELGRVTVHASENLFAGRSKKTSMSDGEEGCDTGPTRDELEEDLERETEQHIATVEALVQCEQDLAQAEHERQAARDALVKSIREKREVTESLQMTAATLAETERKHAEEVEELKGFYRSEKEKMVLTHQSMYQEQYDEIQALRSRLIEMRGQVDRLAWTSTQAENAASMSLAQLCEQLLVAESNATCYGIVEQLNVLLNDDQNLDWMLDSGWINRLCQQTRLLEGRGYIINAACALSSIPVLASEMLKSSIFEVLDDVLFSPMVSDLANGDPTSIASQQHKSFLLPSEWGEAKRQLALMLENVITVPFDDDVVAAEQFMTASRAASLIIHLTTNAARTSNTEQDTIKSCSIVLSKLCNAIPVVKLEINLLEIGIVEALAQLVRHKDVRLTALQCLVGLCADVLAAETLIIKGIQGPLIELLCRWKHNSTVGDELMRHLEEISLCLRLLTYLSRVDIFATPFLTLGGHSAVIKVIEDLHCNDSSTLQYAGEVLVNLLYVNPEIVDQLDCPRKSLSKLVLDSTTLITEDESLRSRSLDVLSRLVEADERGADGISQESIDFMAHALVSDFKAIGYKITYFFYVFCKQNGPAYYLARSSVAHALVKTSVSKGSEMLLWSSVILHSIAKNCLDFWNVPGMIQFVDQDRILVSRAINKISNSEFQDDERDAILSATVLQWYLYMGEADIATPKTTVLLDDTSMKRYSQMMLLLQPTEAAISLLSRVSAESHLFAIFATTCGLLWKLLEAAKESENAESIVEHLSSPIYIALGQEHLFEQSNEFVIDVVKQSDFLNAVVTVCDVTPNSTIVGKVLVLMAQQPWILQALTEAEVGILPILHKIIRSSNSNFKKGATIVDRMVKAGKLDWLWQAGPALLIHILQTSDDEAIQSSMAEILPDLFANSSDEQLLQLRHSTTLSHMSALLEMSSKPLELCAGLSVVSELLRNEAMAISFAQHDGLRVLVDLSLMQQQLGDSARSDDHKKKTLGILREILGYSSPAMVSCIRDQVGVGVLLTLLNDTDAIPLVPPALKIIRLLTDGEAAQELFLQDGSKMLARWYHSGDKLNLEALEEARHAIVNLSWMARATAGRTSYQTLNMIVDDAGLEAWIDALNSPGDTLESVEYKRRALWALATWLAVDDRANKLKVIRSRGVESLLKIVGNGHSAEEERYARLSLGKVLCSSGDELTMRIQLLQSQLRSGAGYHEGLDDMCIGYLGDSSLEEQAAEGDIE